MASNIEKLLAKIEENTRGSGGGLPAVTSEDNGDVLTVVNGAWDKAAPSGTFIVHVTAHWDDDNGAYVVDECDSTAEEVNHAMMAGKPCFAHIYMAGERPGDGMANIIPCLSGYEDDESGVVFSLISPVSTGDSSVGVEIHTLILDPDVTVYRTASYTFAATPVE